MDETRGGKGPARAGRAAGLAAAVVLGCALSVVGAQNRTTTATLRVVVAGLPAGAKAAVVVLGPGGFRRALGSTQSLTGLAAGRYEVGAAEVELAAGAYQARLSGAPLRLEAGRSGRVDVAYARVRPGTLNTSYGRGGIVTTDLGGKDDAAFASALLPDNRLLVAGRSGSSPMVARYTPGGSVDPSFGGGRVLLEFEGGSVAKALALQPDGKVVVSAGDLTFDGSGSYQVARLDSSGRPDPSFGPSGDGKVRADVVGQGDGAAVLVQTDGKVVVAGPAGGAGPALLRFTPVGALDPGFGTSGKVQSEATKTDVPFALAIQRDGKLLVAGQARSPTQCCSSYDLVISRHNADGSLDASFGGGRVLVDLGGAEDVARAVLVQPDGKVLVAGYAGEAGRHDFAVVRLKPDGGLDSGFGREGRVVLDLGRDDLAYGLARQGDGKIVVAGSSGGDAALVRLRADGGADETFGAGGVAIRDLGGRDDALTSVHALANLKILSAGYTNAKGNYDVILAKFHGR